MYKQALLLCSNPISGAWRGGKLRYDFGAFSLAVAGMSIVFDVIVLCFPLPVIRTLKMPTRRKVQIAGIFWLGGLYVVIHPLDSLSTFESLLTVFGRSRCCVAAALRTYFLYKGNQKILQSPTHNQYSYTTREFIWAHIEPNCSIVAACLPTYGPIFAGNKGLKGWLSSVRSFISLSSRTDSSHRFGSEYEMGVTSSEKALVLPAKGSGHWQKLGRTDCSDNDTRNVVDIAGGRKPEADDLEAQQKGTRTMPLQIAVKRGFGTEY